MTTVLSCCKLKFVEGLLMGTWFQKGAVCALAPACSACARWAVESWKLCVGSDDHLSSCREAAVEVTEAVSL